MLDASSQKRRVEEALNIVEENVRIVKDLLLAHYASHLHAESEERRDIEAKEEENFRCSASAIDFQFG